MIQAEAQSDAQVEDQKTEPQVEPDEKVPDEDDLPDDRCMLDEGDSLLWYAWKKMLLEEKKLVVGKFQMSSKEAVVVSSFIVNLLHLKISFKLKARFTKIF